MIPPDSRHKREILKGELAFSLVSVFLGIVVAVVGLAYPNLGYRDLALIVSGALLGLGSLAIHEFLVASPERARQQEERDHYLGPLRTKMSWAYSFGFGAMMTLLIRSGAVAVPDNDENVELASKVTRLNASNLHVLEQLDRMSEKAYAHRTVGPPSVDVVSEFTNSIFQVMSARHQGEVAQAATCGSYLSFLTLLVALIAKNVPIPDNEWSGYWTLARESHAIFFRNGMCGERLVDNTNKQFQELEKDKTMWRLDKAYLSLLEAYSRNLNNDQAETIGLSQFLRTCKTQNPNFLSQAKKYLDQMPSTKQGLDALSSF